MLASIVLSSIRTRVLVITLAVIIGAGSVWVISRTPLEVIPEFSPLSLEVKTEALGLSPSEVESLITVPLEADLLNGVPWMKSIQSESIAGLSSIEMFFAPGTDLMHARQMVDERLTQARALPNVSSPPTLLQPVSSASRIMNIGLTSKSVSLIDMSVQARWEIVPRLMGVSGVANASIWGQQDRQLQVRVDPAKLHAKGVGLDQIVKTAGDAVWESPLTYLESSTPGTGGFVDTPNQRLSVRHIQPILSPEDFAKVPVTGTSVALGDIAQVVETHQPLIGGAMFKDGPGLMIVVEKMPGFNTTDVTRAVERALTDLKPGMAGIDVTTTAYRPASFIERAAHNLSLSVLISAGLVVVSLVVLLATWRAGFVAIVSIALSMVAAGLVIYARHANIDMMVVAGLLMVSGVIVSNAILAADHVFRRLRDERAESAYVTGARVIAKAMLERLRPMIYALLIVVIAVVPGLLLGGLGAGFFRPLIWTYLIAVAASAVVALTVTPALSALLMGKAPAVERGGSGGWKQVEERLLAPAARSPIPAFVVAAAAVGLGVLAWSQLDRSGLPAFRETDLIVELEGAPGTSLPAMERITKGLVADVGAIAGVREVAARIGRAALSHEMDSVESAELSVSIRPGANYDATVAAIQQAVRAHPGLRGDVQAYLSSKVREALTGEDKSVTVRVYGQDADIVRAKADEILAVMSKVDGIVDPQIESQPKTPTVQIAVDLDRAAQHGLKPGDVRRATSLLVSGITVGALFQDQKVFDVVVWGAPEIRQNLSSLENLLIDTESGQQVRLAEVATVRTAPAISVIRRQGVSRRIDIDADVKGRSLADVTADVALRLKDVSFPFEYHAEVLGESLEHQAALRSTIAYVVAAAVMMFLLLQAALGSWRLAAVSLLGVPVALIGGLIGIAASGGVLSLGSMIGLFTVFGFTVCAGLAFVLNLQRLDEAEDASLRHAQVMTGVREMAPTIVAAAVVTALLFLPFLLFGDAAGLELARPAALVVPGGLLTSTLLILLIIPALYLRFGARVPADVEYGDATEALSRPAGAAGLSARA